MEENVLNPEQLLSDTSALAARAGLLKILKEEGVLPTGTVVAAEQTLAPPPQIDRFPIIIGQNLSLTYLSNAFRLCTQGWRYQFVDVINELLEHDPHSRGVVRQRIIAVAGSRLEVYPAALPKGDAEEDLSIEIANEIRRQLTNLPRLSQAMAALAWGSIYGVSAAEVIYGLDDGKWEAIELKNIHSRRINYPNPNSWDPYIYDQGATSTYDDNNRRQPNRTSGMYGLRMADFPGKFIVHAPQLSGDYPTRDGEARYIAFYMALKRTIVRSSAQDFERTIRPWVVGYFGREDHMDKRTPATTADIGALKNAVDALGLGSLSSAVLPTSCKIELLRAASNMPVADFLDFLDGEISKGMLGQTFTSDSQKNGNRNTADVAQKNTNSVSRYDARCLADSLECSLVKSLVELNYPGKSKRLTPRLSFMVDDPPDTAKVMETALKGGQLNMPIDVNKLAEATGLPLVDPKDKTSIQTRLIAPLAVVTPANGVTDKQTGLGSKTDTPVGGDSPSTQSPRE